MLPSTNLTTTLIGNELGISTRSVSQLCTSNNINMWCKYKPIRSNSTAGLTETIWKNANYGILVPTAQSTAEATKTAPWTYAKPRGDVYSEYYRMGDFRLYDKNCGQPITPVGNFTFTFTGSDSITIPFNSTEVTSTSGIIITDLVAISTYYPCVVISLPAGGILYKTAGNTFSSGPQSITINKSELPTQAGGTVYGYYMCAVSNKKTSLSAAPITSTWYSLPTNNVALMNGTITISDSTGLTFEIDGYNDTSSMNGQGVYMDASPYYGPFTPGDELAFLRIASSRAYIRLKFLITNTTSSDYTLNKNQIRVDIVPNLYSSSGVKDVPVTDMYGVGTQSLSSILLPKGETTAVIFDFTDMYKMMSSGTIGTPSTGQMIHSTITLKLSGTTMHNQMFRVRN